MRQRFFDCNIGLEMHALLRTKSKLFCGCANSPSEQPNVHQCSVCTGELGGVPLLNRRAVEMGIAVADLLNCRIAGYMEIERKHFVSVDNAKNYQLTQIDKALGYDGFLRLSTVRNVIGIDRVHIEEDAPRVRERRFLDFNRAGRPLVEIVTAPDMSSPLEAQTVMRDLVRLLRGSGLSECDGIDGGMRFEANVSVHPIDTSDLGTRVEIKNINSIERCVDAIGFEIESQTELLRQGKEVVPETVGLQEEGHGTEALREKPPVSEYRCFPDPQIPGILLDEVAVRETVHHFLDLTRNPAEFAGRYGVSVAQAAPLFRHPGLPRFCLACFQRGATPSTVLNWVQYLVHRILRREGRRFLEVALSTDEFCHLVRLVEDREINVVQGREVLELMVLEGKGLDVILGSGAGYSQLPEGELEKLASRVIEQWQAELVSKGKEFQVEVRNPGVVGHLVERGMRESGNRADPERLSWYMERNLGDTCGE